MNEILFLIGLISIPYFVGWFINKSLRIEDKQSFGDLWYLGILILSFIGIFYFIMKTLVLML